MSWPRQDIARRPEAQPIKLVVIAVARETLSAHRAELEGLGAKVLDTEDPRLLARHLIAAAARCVQPCCEPPTWSEQQLERAIWGRR